MNINKEGSILPGYGKIYALGRAEVADIFLGEPSSIVAQEKIDGSQFSFGVLNGVLHCCSKNCALDIDSPDKLFAKSVATVKAAFDAGRLPEGYIFRGEALCDKRHNTLTYDNEPRGNIVLFDIMRSDGMFVHHDDLRAAAAHIGCEAIQEYSIDPSAGDVIVALKDLLSRPSQLGGKIEGIVIKNYAPAAPPPYGGRVLMGKYVSEEFKEVHGVAWKKSNPGRKDVVDSIIEMYKVEARWEKAVNHLKEDGLHKGDYADIGNLIKYVVQDLKAEEQENIKQMLFNHFFGKYIARGITDGLPQWYKEKLIKDTYENSENPKVT